MGFSLTWFGLLLLLAISTERCTSVKLLLDSKDCPKGWYQPRGDTRCYKVVFENLSWYVAGLNCKALNEKATLPVINNDDDQGSVSSVLAKAVFNPNITNCNNDKGHRFWIAGQRSDPDPAKNTAFLWRTKSSCKCGDTETWMGFTSWDTAKKQPDNYQKQEACIQIYTSRYYQWYDANCLTGYCSVCVMPGKKTP